MSEEAGVIQTIEKYIEGGVKGDAALMAEAFDPAATIYSVVDGKSEGGPIQILFDAVDGSPAPNLTGDIGPIDLNVTTATATVVLSDWAGAEFTDQFTLLKTGDSWKILSKVYLDRTPAE